MPVDQAPEAGPGLGPGEALSKVVAIDVDIDGVSYNLPVRDAGLAHERSPRYYSQAPRATTS